MKLVWPVKPAAGVECAKAVYKKAGITDPRREIDCAELYVPFSWFEPMWLEGHLICEEGEGWNFVDSGATEIGAWSYECRAQSGGIHANEAMFLVEIEDPSTGEIIDTPGKPGKMIITALDRMAQPCVRFDSKDIIEWAAEPCPCGSGKKYKHCHGR